MFIVLIHMTIVVSSFRKEATRTAWKSTFDRNKLKFNFRSQNVCYYQEPWISFIISNCHVNSIKCHMLKSCQKPRPLKKLGDNDRHSLVFFSSKMSCPLLWRSNLLKQLKVTIFFMINLKSKMLKCQQNAQNVHICYLIPLCNGMSLKINQ